MRTVNDFNDEYLYRCWLEEVKTAEKPKGSVIKNAIFYGVLVIIVLLAFVYSGSEQAGKTFGPFAYNTVLTESMKAVYPPGTLITSWKLREGEPVRAGLENGTDIVFLRDEESKQVIVHRIIEVIDNYEDTGMRGFRTQGVSNPKPDSWVVWEGRVIGKVTGHVHYLGMILEFIAAQFIWVIGGVAIIFGLITALRIVFAKDGEKR